MVEPRVINLYLAVQGLPNGIHHRPAEYVKHHPRGLVAGKTELTLQQQSGHAGLSVVIRYAAQNQWVSGILVR